MGKINNHDTILTQVARLAKLNDRLVYGHQHKPVGEDIFISYRREDSGYAGRVYDWLQKSFPKRKLFMDVDAIGIGADFIKKIDLALNSAKILVVLIGPRWLAGDSTAKNRLFNKADIVKHEITSGIDRDIPILPILLGNAKMPQLSDLPSELASLSTRNALEIKDLDWNAGMAHLVNAVKSVLGGQDPSEENFIAHILVLVGEFIEDPDPEIDDGDFLIIGAGKIKDDKPAFAIEVMANENHAWCELASEMYTRDRVEISNQILRLQDLGWNAPPEGAYTTSWFKGKKLTRWWRDIDSRTMEGDFEDVTKAILKTFLEVYGAIPQGIMFAWASIPNGYPGSEHPGSDQVNSSLAFTIRPTSPAWR